ncbi:MAG TPA: hypothetical protein VJ999_14280 [Candidatus Sulfotelmatobacter sp.]|nr:hypothetical protein [Candidatus Sulfotelmatobacter sp.]
MEIRSFLEALESYPLRFAEDRSKGRRVSFEEHRRSLVHSGESVPRSR